MSEYKRLTKKGTAYVTNDGEHDIIVQISADNSEQPLYDLEDICSKLNRLAELEDKIESGKLVELPCKVGDTVWYLNTTPSMHLARGTVYEGHIARYHIVRYPLPLGICVCADIQIHNEYGTSEIPNVKDLGKSWFLTKAQAEARLKELKGELK